MNGKIKIISDYARWRCVAKIQVSNKDIKIGRRVVNRLESEQKNYKLFVSSEKTSTSFRDEVCRQVVKRNSKDRYVRIVSFRPTSFPCFFHGIGRKREARINEGRRAVRRRDSKIIKITTTTSVLLTNTFRKVTSLLC